MALTVLSVAYPLASVRPNAVGGAEQVLASLDAALVRAGHQSLVVACAGSEVAGTLISVRDLCSQSGLVTDAVRTAAAENHRRAIEYALRRWPVDIIHLHGIDFIDYLPDTHLPVVVTLHLPLAWYPAEALKPRPNVHLCCVSECQRRTAPAGAASMHLLPNGVELPTSIGGRKKRRFVMMLCRICPEKGVHLGMDAARRAGLPMLVAGKTYPYPEHARYLWDEVIPRIGRRCRISDPLGPVPKRRLLSAARCLLVPSLAAETSSLVTMEALACGTPVVAYPSGALPELIDPGRTGFLVEDPDQMAGAILEAARLDPEQCRDVARSEYSAEAMAGRYLTLYGWVRGS